MTVIEHDTLSDTTRVDRVDGAQMIKPTGDRILIKRIAHEEREHNGLWLPALPKEAPMVCEVLAVGPGKKTDDGARIPVQVKAGDRVLIGRWAGTELKVNGVDYRLLESDEIIGIVDGPGTLTVME